MIDLKPLIQAYISAQDSFSEKEKYKWLAIRSFKENYFKVGLSLSEKLKLSFKDAGNLLASQNYFPAGMLVIFAKEKKAETKKMLDLLFNESFPLHDRIVGYLKKSSEIFKSLQTTGFKDWKGRKNIQTFQDTHAISVYLSLRYPDKYYIYKWSVFKTAAEVLGYSIKARDKVDKLLEFYEFCDSIKVELKKEKTFLSCYQKRLKEKQLIDPALNLLTQDFIYAIARYLNADYFRNEKRVIAGRVDHIEVSALKKKEEHNVLFRGKKGIDYSKQDELYRSLGRYGEEWAVNFEIERLNKQGIVNKSAVRHASLLDGDGIGYDILSVEEDGKTDRYIEVKTTTGDLNQPLYFSQNELMFSNIHSDHFYLYRIYNFTEPDKKADVVIIKGSLKQLNAEPVLYKASLVFFNAK